MIRIVSMIVSGGRDAAPAIRTPRTGLNRSENLLLRAACRDTFGEGRTERKIHSVALPASMRASRRVLILALARGLSKSVIRNRSHYSPSPVEAGSTIKMARCYPHGRDHGA